MTDQKPEIREPEKVSIKDALKGVLKSGSTALLAFILVIVAIVFLLIGILFGDIIQDYAGIYLHKEFKDNVMERSSEVPEKPYDEVSPPDDN